MRLSLPATAYKSGAAVVGFYDPLSTPRFTSTLLSMFGALALVLSAVGLR